MCWAGKRPSMMWQPLAEWLKEKMIWFCDRHYWAHTRRGEWALLAFGCEVRYIKVKFDIFLSSPKIPYCCTEPIVLFNLKFQNKKRVYVYKYVLLTCPLLSRMTPIRPRQIRRTIFQFLAQDMTGSWASLDISKFEEKPAFPTVAKFGCTIGGWLVESRGYVLPGSEGHTASAGSLTKKSKSSPY